MVPLKSRFGKMSGASRVQRYRATHIQLETIFTQAEPIFLWKSSNLVPWGLEGRNKVGYTTMYIVVCTALFYFVHALPCCSDFMFCFASSLSSFCSIPTVFPLSLRVPFLTLFPYSVHVHTVLLACDKIAPCKSAFRRLRLFIILLDYCI